MAPVDASSEELRSLSVNFIPLTWDNSGIRLLAELRSLLQMLRGNLTQRPDIVFTFTPKINIYFGLVARLLGLRHVPNISGLGSSFLRGPLLRRATLVLYRLALKRSEVVFFQNEADRELFIRLGIVRSAQARLVPGSGVNLSKFRPVPRPAPPAGAPYVFLMVGRLLIDKGILEYAEAASMVKAEYPGTVFRLAGRFDPTHPASVTSTQLESWERAGPIDYLGVVDDIRACLVQADCLVLPSYREGMPRAVLEASAMGLPSIVTDVPGCRDAVSHGETGLICRAKNATDLARSMKEMLGLAQEVRRQMGSKARRRMEQSFDERLVIDSYLEVLCSDR